MMLNALCVLVTPQVLHLRPRWWDVMVLRGKDGDFLLLIFLTSSRGAKAP